MLRPMPVSMWNPTPGLYTRYGDVTPLLTRVDDRLVIMGSGDEIRLLFPAAALPPLKTGLDARLPAARGRLGQGRRRQHGVFADRRAAAVPRHERVSVSAVRTFPGRCVAPRVSRAATTRARRCACCGRSHLDATGGSALMRSPTLKTLLGAGLIVLLVNTAYIAAFATPTIFYMTNVLAHLVMGSSLTIGLGLLLGRDAESAAAPGRAGVLFGVAAVLAVYLAIVGNTHDHAWVLRAHIVAVGARGRRADAVRDRRRALGGAKRAFGYLVPVTAVVALAFPLAVMALRQGASVAERPDRQPGDGADVDGRGGRRARSRPSSPRRRRPTSAGSSRRTSSWIRNGAASATRTSTSSGRARCTTSRRSTTSSTASRSSTCRTSSGTQPSKWCAGCHDHAVFFNGRFDRPIKEQIDTPEAHAGPGLHVVPRHHARGQQHGQRRLHDRVPAAARAGERARTRSSRRSTTS